MIDSIIVLRPVTSYDESGVVRAGLAAMDRIVNRVLVGTLVIVGMIVATVGALLRFAF